MEWVGATKLVIFVVVINVWPLNGLKLQTIQSLETAVSASTSSGKSDTFWLRREQPPTPTPHSPLSPLHRWPNHSICYIQLALNFLCEKIICPIKNPFEQGSVKDVASPLIFLFFCLELQASLFVVFSSLNST